MNRPQTDIAAASDAITFEFAPDVALAPCQVHEKAPMRTHGSKSGDLRRLEIYVEAEGASDLDLLRIFVYTSYGRIYKDTHIDGAVYRFTFSG